MTTEPDIRKPPIDPAIFFDQASRLLNDYATKLRAMTEDASQLLSEDPKLLSGLADVRYAHLKERLNYLVPPCTELIRQVSAMIEQGRLTDLERVGLWLPLTELEVAFRQAKGVILDPQNLGKNGQLKQRGKS
jgi:hypothetical protein